MKITYDKSADAAYIYFREAKSQEIVSTQGDLPVHVDIGTDGEVIGIEIMDASKVFAENILQKGEI